MPRGSLGLGIAHPECHGRPGATVAGFYAKRSDGYRLKSQKSLLARCYLREQTDCLNACVNGLRPVGAGWNTAGLANGLWFGAR